MCHPKQIKSKQRAYKLHSKLNVLKVKSMCHVSACPAACQCFLMNFGPIGGSDACIDSHWLSSPWVCFTVRAPCLPISSDRPVSPQADRSIRQIAVFDVKKSFLPPASVCVCACVTTPGPTVIKQCSLIRLLPSRTHT